MFKVASTTGGGKLTYYGLSWNPMKITFQVLNLNLIRFSLRFTCCIHILIAIFLDLLFLSTSINKHIINNVADAFSPVMLSVMLSCHAVMLSVQSCYCTRLLAHTVGKYFLRFPFCLTTL